MVYTEKEPLLDKTSRLAAEGEVLTITCPPLFTLLLSKPFQCLQLTRHRSHDSEEEESDDDDLPDLPYVVKPQNLPPPADSPGERLSKLRRLMKEHGIGVYIVPLEDEHQSEYTALADRRREYLSGFTGSAGLCVVTLDDAETLSGKAALSTDGRYFLQAEKQLDPKHWQLLKRDVVGYLTWYQFAMNHAAASRFSNVISCDPRLISVATGEFLTNMQRLRRYKFKPILTNLVDAIWTAKPERSLLVVYELPLKFTGQHTNDKITKIKETLKERGASYLVLTALDDIAWLFNLRSDDDVPFTPVFFSYAVVGVDSVNLFIDSRKLDPSVKQYLSTITNLGVHEYTGFYSFLSSLSGKVILPDKAASAYALVWSLEQAEVLHESVVANTKIFKNPTELFNTKIAQYKDLLAFILFLAWLDRQLSRGTRVTEYQAAQKIYSIRAKFPNFKGLSYETISSTGSNAAIIHYAPTKKENSVIDPEKIFLIDSGAQYLEGTTDITRTYFFGRKLNPEYVKFYSLVLKGHLAVATAKFPPNSKSTGTILDAYARQPLWNEGRDFNHGTGHGVGSFGNVHEGPLYISTTTGGSLSVDLFKPGGLLTDEPGYYVDGEYGIRIESELEIVECDASFGRTRQGSNFLGFAYLTKVPFCRRLIDKQYLLEVEINWINEFHKSIRRDFAIKLLEMGEFRAHKWLFKETEPL